MNLTEQQAAVHSLMRDIHRRLHVASVDILVVSGNLPLASGPDRRGPARSEDKVAEAERHIVAAARALEQATTLHKQEIES